MWSFSSLFFQSGGPQQEFVCFITRQNEVTPSPIFFIIIYFFFYLFCFFSALFYFYTPVVGSSIFSLSLNLMLFCFELLFFYCCVASLSPSDLLSVFFIISFLVVLFTRLDFVVAVIVIITSSSLVKNGGNAMKCNSN